MCIICIEFDKGNLTAREGLRAMSELIREPEADLEHLFELQLKLADAAEDRNE